MFRWFILLIFLACLAISVFYRRRARLESGTILRRREGGALIALRVGVALPLFLAIVLTVVWPRWMAWASFPLPEWAAWVRWVGVVLGVLSVPSVYWVFASIGSNISETVLTKDQHQLITHGPYRWVRHPLYTTGIVLLLSVGLMAASWFILLFVGIALVLILTVVIPAEERKLVEKFGEAYRELQRRTGRLLPRFF